MNGYVRYQCLKEEYGEACGVITVSAGGHMCSQSRQIVLRKPAVHQRRLTIAKGVACLTMIDEAHEMLS